MQPRLLSEQPWDVAVDVLVIPIVGEPTFQGQLAELDRRSGGELSALARLGELRSKRFSSALGAPGELRAGRLLTVSTGPSAELDAETVRWVAASAIRRLGGSTVHRLGVWLDPLLGGSLDGAAAAEQVARGIVEGAYDPHALYQAESECPPPVLDELVVVATDAGSLSAAVERGIVIGEGTNLARDLANRSAAEMYPEVLAGEARAIAERHGLWIDVIDERRAAELGMGLFLAVGRGSDNPPRMIVMRSGAEGERDGLGRHLAMVGKGVCFDSGGISIKTADRMEEMKMDKAGASAVIAAMSTLARLAPGTPALAVTPAVENLPGPHSTRPGDVIRALNGKWVDITNTDAEGRLILADGMTYAERLGATHVVDVATLTGAVARALGHLVTGAFGTPDSWYDQVAAAAGRAGERLWRLPLVEEYWPEMHSWYGDMVNSGSADAGAIKSALFLRRFVTTPWVHLDIAGTGYYRRATEYASKGATGAAHATLVELALAGAR
jgi:leucyl aminopeptidase